jgi:glycosyltransferase involved in cell wall biosynthesis
MSRISIITINLNNFQGLQRTISSVSSQSFKDIEYIIIDGGSTDESIDIIKKNAGTVSFWISENDNGIYNAMNKGITKANGNYLLFLNSGDVLADEKAIEKFASLNTVEDVVFGHLKYQDNSREEWVPPQKLDFEFFVNSSLAHPSTFIKKNLFERVGLYNERIKIVADWKFFLDAVCRFYCSYRKIDFCISAFDTTGVSSNEQKVKAEMFEVLTKEYGDFLYNLYKRDHETVNHVRDSRLIALFKKIGFLSNIKF